MCRGPHAHGDQVARLGADPVDQPAEEQESKAVSRLEPENDVAVTAFRPTIELLQRRLEDAEDQPVDVAEHDGGEEQAADAPAQPRALAGGRNCYGGNATRL